MAHLGEEGDRIGKRHLVQHKDVAINMDSAHVAPLGLAPPGPILAAAPAGGPSKRRRRVHPQLHFLPSS
jgi:hypothetical protein